MARLESPAQYRGRRSAGLPRRTTEAEPSSDAARDALYRLEPDQVTGDLLAVHKSVSEIPSASGKVAVMGFCWGGSQTFRFATNSSDLAAVE